MPSLIAKALCSLSEARAYVLRDPLDASQDVLLTTLINAYSKAIPRYCARQMFAENGDEKLFTYDGSGYLDLEPYELRTVTTITIQSAGLTSETVDPVSPTVSTGYILEPQEKTPEGTYTWMRMPKVGNPLSYPATIGSGYLNLVKLTGNWGMTEVPEDARLACLLCVDWRHKNPSGAQNVDVGSLSATAYARTSRGGVPPFPPEAMAHLELLARPELGV